MDATLPPDLIFKDPKGGGGLDPVAPCRKGWLSEDMRFAAHSLSPQVRICRVPFRFLDRAGPFGPAEG